jgi:hypothetical protein
MASEWTELLVTYDSVEAGIIEDLLKSGGIAVVVRSAKATPYPVNLGKMGEIKILVREEDKVRAEEALKELGSQNTDG